jgi:NitT/TauT family transport system ATP-binding protein
LLLDEPFSALDYESKLSLEAEVLQFVRDKCGTMVFVTHDIDEAIAVGHRLVVLEGRPAAGRPAGIVLDKDVTFVSDRAGRDPAVVRQDPAFANYFRAIWSALRDEQA